jgi:hypothetical protein
MRIRAAALLFLLFVVTPLRALDTGAWLADFHQILAEMSSHYANLDSAIDDRGLDLPALRNRYEQRIRDAKSDADARAAIDEFLAAFGDGHVRVDWNVVAAPESASTPTRDTRPLCERLGYAAGAETRSLDFTRIAEFQPLDDADAAVFPGGILRLDAKRRAGILRIRLFMETTQPQLCESVVKSLALANDAECDRNCAWNVQLAVGDLMTSALQRRVEALRHAGATTLVVDLTGNGGGSNWVQPAARVLTRVALRGARLAFIRHDHWATVLGEWMEDVDYDLAHDAAPHAQLLAAKTTLTRAIEEARRACDRSGVWSDPPQRPDCSLVVRDLLFATGVLPYSKPGAFPRELHAHGSLFDPSNYAYVEGANQLPLVIVVDENTASASEELVAMMQDNHAATIAGSATHGSGCGYTDGGIPATLAKSGAALHLPDCVRLRADGTNEVLGITPDVLIPFRRADSRYQKAVKARQALMNIAK